MESMGFSLTLLDESVKTLIVAAAQSHPELGDVSAIEKLADALQCYFHITIYFFGTDKGGDQQGNEK
eukprot:579611-Karenia_brevis.AAC.1